VEKYCRTGQATADNMAHAHCAIDANTQNKFNTFLPTNTLTYLFTYFMEQSPS
jgi:hypothetical protein